MDGTHGQRVDIFDDLIIDHTNRTVVLAGQLVPLTATEFSILEALAAASGATVTYDELKERVWGHRWFARRDHLSSHIHRIRSQLYDTVPTPRFIQNVRGIGYRFGTPPLNRELASAVNALLQLDRVTSGTVSFYTLVTVADTIDWVTGSVKGALGWRSDTLIGETVSEFATVNDDGTYSWKHRDGGVKVYRPSNHSGSIEGNLTLWQNMGSSDAT